MESVKRILRERYWRKGVIYFLTWCLVVNTSVLAAPSGGDFTVGEGTIIVDGANTAVTVNQAQSVIQWGAPGSGGIDTIAGESLTFLQTEGLSNSAVLNRIMSGNPTQFDGTLSGVDMRIFMVNPAGIIFGIGSQVNVSQLVASGLNMSDTDFLNATGESPADLRFEGGNGIVHNWGEIQANSIYLIGKQVKNSNGIMAPGGLIVLAAGDRVYLAQDGSSVLVEVDGPSEYPYDIENVSLISAGNGGKIVLAAGDTFSRAIRNGSWLVAAGGSIEMHAARIEVGGVILASTGDSGADGGTVTITGVEEVTTVPRPKRSCLITADGGANGNGGTVTIESQGTVTIAADTLITARGGSTSGDGGSVKITGEHFVMAGEIDASPGNTDYEPGTLTIDPPTVTIANGANAGAMDTLYEDDIETWGTKGTSLIVYADDAITVQGITDGEIKGRYGNIELYATGAESLISFEDTGDTISTTLGDILMTAGSGGLNIGSLQTGGENLEATPGEIHLSTHDGGDIAAENLTIHGGQGHAEINVDAADDLTISGDVSVGRDLPGSDSPIYNVPNGQDAEAMIVLKAGDEAVLNGDVTANSHGINEDAEGSVTKSYIGIFSGTGVPVFGSTTVNGDLVATAKSSINGTSDATIEIDAWGTITWGEGVAAPLADGDAGQVHVQSKESAEDTKDGDVARIIINEQGNLPELTGLPDFEETHMGTLVESAGSVLDNDFDPEGDPLTATLVDGPTHAESFTLNADGSYSYTPQAGYVGTDSFTYTASDGVNTSDPTLVTIEMTNTPPLAAGETPTTHMGVPVAGTIQDNISDPDGDPLTTGLVTDVEHGTLTLNPDDGTYSYEPEAGYVGTDSFTYSVADPQIGAEPAQAMVTITMTNVQPVLGNDTATTSDGAAVAINILANDADPEGDPFTTAVASGPTHGTVTQNLDGTFTYTPAKDFVGQDTFTYSASDGQTGAVPTLATVTIMVGAGPAPLFGPVAPGLERVEFEVSGCPALVKWAATELGVGARTVEIRIANALALTRDIQPCDTCADLKDAAMILKDADGTHVAALTQIINEFAPAGAPPTEEQMATIADTIAKNAKANNRYAVAGEYLDAVAQYVGVLAGKLGFTAEESVLLVTDKYISRLSQTGNAGVAAMVAKLAVLAAK